MSGDITVIACDDNWVTEEQLEGLEVDVEGVLESFGVFGRQLRVVVV